MSESSAIESGFVEVGSARLAYDVAGAGHSLVLVHAGVADKRMWDQQFAAFAARFRTVRYDLRGYGDSTLPAESFANHDDLRGLLDAFGIDQAHLVGLSFGGKTALDTALAYPERVAGLVVIGASPSGVPPSEELKAAWQTVDELVETGDVAGAIEFELRMWVDGPGRAPGSAPADVRERVRVMEELAFARAADEPEIAVRSLDPPAIDRLGEVRAPTLILVGDQDYPEILDHARRMAEEIPDARLEVIPGVAHMVNMEAPARFTASVLEFLGGR